MNIIRKIKNNDRDKRLNLNQKQKLEFLELMSTSLSPNTVDWLDWKYINNPMVKNEPTVFGAIHKASGKLVGIKPFLACNIIFENKTFKAAQQVIPLYIRNSEERSFYQYVQNGNRRIEERRF